MRLDNSVATGGIVKFFAKRSGENLGNVGVEVLKSGVDGAANLAAAKSADGFIDGNNAAHFGGVEALSADDFHLRIDHLAARGTELIDFDFTVENNFLAGSEAPFEVTTVKKFAGERAGIVLNEKMVDGVAAVHAANGLAAHDAGANGVDIVGLDVFDPGEVEAIFVAKRKIVEEIVESVDAALGEEFGALRPYTFDHANFGI